MRATSLVQDDRKSPGLNPVKCLWDVVEREVSIMDVQPADLQKLCDSIMSIRTRTSEECPHTLRKKSI